MGDPVSQEFEGSNPSSSPFFFQAEDGIRDCLLSRGLGDVYKRQGYITYMLEDTMQKDKTFAKYAPKLELVSIEDDRVIIKNNIQYRIAEIVYHRGELYCQLCEAKDCHCIGYVWSIPEIYEKLSSKGLRHSK